MKVFDRQGVAHDVPDDQVVSALKSGQYGLPKGAPVPFKLEDGTIGTVPSEHLVTALDNGSGTIASPQEYRQADVEARHGGVLGHAAALGEGLARGATVGLSDPLAVGVAGAFGGDSAREATRTHLAETKEAHPYLTTGGELAGAVAPLFLSGGASAPVSAAEGAASLARVGAEGASLVRGGAEAVNLARTGEAVATAAKAAEATQATGLVSSTARVLEAAKLPVQVIGGPTRGIAEVGNLVEHGIGKLLGKEATTAAGRIAQAGIKQAGRGAAEGALFGLGNEVSESTLGNTDLNGEKLLAALGHGALLGGALAGGLGAAGQMTREVVGAIAPRIAGAADFQAFKALDPRRAFIKEAERIPGGGEGIGRRMLDDKIVSVGDTIEDLAPKVSAKRTEAGEKIGELLKGADTAGYEGPKLLNVYRGLAETEERLNKLPSMNRGAIDKIASIKADFERAVGIEMHPNPTVEELSRYGRELKEAKFSFQQAQDLRARIDDAIKWSTNPLSPVNEMGEALKGVRGALETEIERAGDDAGRKLGHEWLADYKDAKLAYRQYTVADKAAENGIAWRQANRTISPTDYLSGMAAAAGGIASGHAILGPVGGLASAMAHHVVRERGNSTAAVLLDKIAALTAVRRATAAVDREVDRGVARILSDEKPRARPKLRHFTGADEHEQRRDAVTRAKANRDAHSENIDAATQGLADHAPLTAAAFRSAAMRATSTMAKAIPSIGPAPSLTPMLDKREPSDHEKDQFDGTYEVIHEPTRILDDVHAGSVTPDQVKAVEATYPGLYKEMSDKLRGELASLKTPLTYQRELAIGVFLQQPFNQTQTPEFTQAMQQNYASPSAGVSPSKPKPGKPVNFGSQHSLTGLSKEHAI